MKKLFLLAATAALILTSCAKIESTQQIVEKNEPISFGVYAGRTADTKATYGDITTDNLKTSTDGFGVFAYYTLNNDWQSTDIPNFMYNQQVKYIASYGTPADFIEAKYPSKWYYTPLKYWPNGQNSTTYAANTTSADKVSFYAYAPHIATVNTVPASGQGITAMSSNSTAGAPSVTFTVPTKAEEQIDLLWAIPVKNVTKQAISGRVAFTFKHALSKLNFQVQAVVDATSPTTTNLTDDGDETFEEGETWIVLQSLNVVVNGTKTGTLTLDSETASSPNWSSKSGNTSIDYASSSFTSTVTADSKTGFKVTETATDLNSAISPMVIPGDLAADDLTITANYWVITKDTKLNSGYSTIQNVISKTNASAITLAAGNKYNIVVRLGLNSIDFNVTEVTDWSTGAAQNYDLPVNAS